MNKKQKFLLLILCVIGLVVWVVIGEISNNYEAWDSVYYFAIGLPVICIASGIAGYMEPKDPYVYGIAAIILQPVALIIQTGIDPLMLLGLIIFIFFAAFTIASSYVGAAFRKKKNDSHLELN